MKTSEEALVAKINADNEYKLISKIEGIVIGRTSTYGYEIIKDLKLLKSGLSFRLPSANNDWALDVLAVITYLCKKQHGGMITAEHHDEQGVSIYIDVYFNDINDINQIG